MLFHENAGLMRDNDTILKAGRAMIKVPTKRWEDLVEARSSSNSTISTNNIIYAK